MPSPRSRPDHEPLAELAAGYALDALEPADLEVFEAHLPTCPACAEQVEGVRAVAAQLAIAQAEQPPAGLRSAILDSLDLGAAGTVHALPVRPRGTHRAAWSVGVAASVVLGLLAWNVSLHQQVTSGRTAVAQAQQLIDCGAAKDCTTLWLGSASTGAAAAVLARPGSVQLVVDRLPADDASRETYVLWQQVSDGSMRAVTTFDVRSKGLSLIDAGSPLQGVTRQSVFAVSLERGRQAPARPSSPILTPADA